MKKMILLLISLSILTVSNITYAEDPMPYGRKAAEYTGGNGTDPNGNGAVLESKNQSGLTVTGYNPAEQVPICEHCQNQNLFLTEAKKIAPRYVPKNSDDSSAGGVKSDR